MMISPYHAGEQLNAGLLASAFYRLAEAITHPRVDQKKMALQRKLRRQMLTAFAAQKAQVLRAFVAQRRHFAEAADPLPFAWLSTILERTLHLIEMPVTAAARSAMLLGALVVIRDLALGDNVFSLSNPRAAAYLDEVINRSSQINETTFERIRGILRDGVANGESYQQMAQRIRDTFDGMGAPSPLEHIRDRAELIAVTEIGDAYSEAQLIVGRGLQDAGLEMVKSWLTVGDDRVDPDCAGNEDEGWIGIEDAFSSGDDRPLAHPGCRCVIRMKRKAA